MFSSGLISGQCRRLIQVCVVLATVFATNAAEVAASPSCNRDIWPLLSDCCFPLPWTDEAAQKRSCIWMIGRRLSIR
ncbi:MAG: hypothetical protein M2R45_01002 [Verrucomicrobia subdivision 3 bacterium]|nr:hypothetical protein [Limisphaerales bacterium]MCS1414112.1 hypothetical protein [Limisphaerales bacterium]